MIMSNKFDHDLYNSNVKNLAIHQFYSGTLDLLQDMLIANETLNLLFKTIQFYFVK